MYQNTAMLPEAMLVRSLFRHGEGGSKKKGREGGGRGERATRGRRGRSEEWKTTERNRRINMDGEKKHRRCRK